VGKSHEDEEEVGVEAVQEEEEDRRMLQAGDGDPSDLSGGVSLSL
jgi:hypothetical protein